MKTFSEVSIKKLLNLIKTNFFRKSEALAVNSVSVDSTPTAGSTNLVTSGGVKAAIDAAGGGLPAASVAGTAAIYNGTSWMAQTGYGYSMSDIATYDGNRTGKVVVDWSDQTESGELYLIKVANAKSPTITSITANGEDDFVEATISSENYATDFPSSQLATNITAYSINGGYAMLNVTAPSSPFTNAGVYLAFVDYASALGFVFGYRKFNIKNGSTDIINFNGDTTGLESVEYGEAFVCYRIHNTPIDMSNTTSVTYHAKLNMTPTTLSKLDPSESEFPEGLDLYGADESMIQVINYHQVSAEAQEMGFTQTGFYVQQSNQEIFCFHVSSVNFGTSGQTISNSLLPLATSQTPGIVAPGTGTMIDAYGNLCTYVTKSAMDATAAVNTVYILTAPTSITTALPSTATAGQPVTIIWYNGATAVTPTITAATGTLIPYTFTAHANTRCELNAMFDGSKWSVIVTEQFTS